MSKDNTKWPTPPFIILPYKFLEYAVSKKIGLKELIVLQALLSWRKYDTDLVKTSRERIKERCEYGLQDISKITTSLQKKGIIEKFGNGGNSKWCLYKINDLEEILGMDGMNKPAKLKKSKENSSKRTVYDLTTVYDDTVHESHTVNSSQKDSTVDDSYTPTVDDSYTGTVYDSYTPTVDDSYTGIHTERKYIKKIHKENTERVIGESKIESESKSNNLAIVSPPLATSSNLPVLAKKPKILSPVEKPADVDQQVWDDFVGMRKKAKRDLNATALKGIECQAIKAGITLEQAIAHCCERGWIGFNASWYKNANKSFGGKEEVTMDNIMDKAKAQADRILKQGFMGDFL